MHKHEIPKVVVSALRLRYLIVRLRFAGVNEVREFKSVIDEEDGNVVPDNVPIAFFRVKLHGEASYVSYSVGATSAAKHRREADKGGSFP